MENFGKWWHKNMPYFECGDDDALSIWNAAVAAEREACADVCDRIFAKRDLQGNRAGADAAEFCATEIRKRTNVEVRRGPATGGETK